MAALVLPGCYASAGATDARDAAPSDAAQLDAARLDAAQPDSPEEALDAGTVGPGVSLRLRSAPSTEVCPEWDVPTHPSPTVPPGTADGLQPLWQHSDPVDGYIGNIGLAPDGSIRVLGPRAATFLRIERDGTVAWRRDVGAQVYNWAIAPDGSVFGVANTDAAPGERLIELAPDGTLVGEYDFGARGPGIREITFGAHGQVYVPNGSLFALCRTSHVLWEVTATMASGAAAEFHSPVVDSEGALLAPMTGTTRAARISEDGALLEWMGDDRPVGMHPAQAFSVITSVFGTRAILYSIVDLTWMEESTLAVPGLPPTNRRLLRHFNAHGRLISGDGMRSNGWLWEQGDGTVVYTDQLCSHPATPVFLEDGGLLCFGERSVNSVLRRVSADGDVIWEDASLPRPANVLFSLDVDGHLTYVAAIDDTRSEVRSVQTNMRPARGHWGEANAFTRYTR